MPSRSLPASPSPREAYGFECWKIGACFVAASYIVRRQIGIAPRFRADDLDKIHRDLAEVSSRLSLLAVARATRRWPRLLEASREKRTRDFLRTILEH